MSTAGILALREEVTFDEQGIRNILIQLCSLPANLVESESIEVKSWCRDERQLAEKIGEAAACLANASGGILIFGVEEEPTTVPRFRPCPYLNVTESWISQRIHDQTMPPVEVTVRDISNCVRQVSGLADATGFAVLIPKSKRIGGHITVAGLSKIRSGRECRPYYSVEEDFTRVPVELVTASDPSIDSVKWGLEQHCRKFRLAQSPFENEIEFLLHMGLIERHVPQADNPSYRVSLAGLLLFGKQAALRKSFGSFESVLVSDQGTVRLQKNIVETFQELCGPRSGLLLALSPRVPAETIKELLINAYIHRSYRLNSPVTIRVTAEGIEIQSPGELPTGLHAENLIHCVPIYRNFLLAEGARYLGLCDKIGQGIDLVYSSVLQNGFGFPSFESAENRVTARIPAGCSAEFREFTKKRSQGLTQLEELMVLRLLWDKERVSAGELFSLMQRGAQVGQSVLDRMFRKVMIEPVNGMQSVWQLNPVVRKDIETIFSSDQMGFDPALFGDS